MEIAIGLLAIAPTVLGGSWFSDRLGLSAPLVLILVGIIGSYLPFVPEVALSPELVLLGILPPLLYAAAIRTSLVDFRNNRAVILSLSVGLVLFTALGVAVFLQWALGIDFWVAFALGAVVGAARRGGGDLDRAPDRSAEAAGVDPRGRVARQRRDGPRHAAHRAWPRRGSPASAFGTEVTVGTVVGDFVWASLGGVAVGLGIAVVVSVLRKHFTDRAGLRHRAVVHRAVRRLRAGRGAARLGCHRGGRPPGSCSGTSRPRTQSAASRLSERINWSSIQFLLENAVFLLIGLQVFYVLDRGARTSGLGASARSRLAARRHARASCSCCAASGSSPSGSAPRGCCAARRRRRGRTRPCSRGPGMRGVVTLAAALLLPDRHALARRARAHRRRRHGRAPCSSRARPCRASRRRLGVRGPDPRRGRPAGGRPCMAAASRAGLAELGERRPTSTSDHEGTADAHALRGPGQPDVGAPRRARRRRGRDARATATARPRWRCCSAERTEVLPRCATRAAPTTTVLRVVLSALDLEETMLDRDRRPGRAPGRQRGAAHGDRSRPPASTCARSRTSCVEPRTPDGLRGVPARRHARGCTCACA